MANIKSEQTSILCRLCLNPTDFNNLSNLNDVKELVEECLTIQLNLHDQLPQNVCFNCSEQLNKFKTFKDECLKHDRWLTLLKLKHTDMIADEDILKFTADNLRHVKNELNDDQSHAFQCNVCSRTFKSNSTYRGHKLRHFKAQFECEYLLNGVKCTGKFYEARYYGYHARKYHGIDKSICCSVDGCKDKFYVTAQLDAHLRTRHQRYDGKIVGDSSVGMVLDDLNPTKNTAMTNPDVKNPEGKSICTVCGRTVKRLDTHMTEIHAIYKIHSKTEFPCYKCPGTTFKTAQERKRHRVQQHSINKICPVCGLTFSASNYSKHLKLHRMNDANRRDYACDQCDRTFNLQVNLYSHKLMHDGKVGCPICQKPQRKSTMNRHIASVHECVKKYECDKCGEKFKTLTTKQRHFVLTHTNQRGPYLCQMCDKAFFTRSKLRRHERVHLRVDEEDVGRE